MIGENCSPYCVGLFLCLSIVFIEKVNAKNEANHFGVLGKKTSIKVTKLLFICDFLLIK
jgi:hypothetical protein